ncbi:MAG: PorT family protein [Prevotellaceae bacterium]|jgi:cytoskeletal protein RodZ|nr:PorT family protein [Prevotellaceae bacterium]
MSDDLNNREFEELIRSKLEDYRTPVDPGSWDAIEKSLIQRKRVKYLYVAASMVAAAAVLFMVTLNLPDSGKLQNTIPDAGKQTSQETATPNQTTQDTESTDRQTPASQMEQKQPVSSSVHSSAVTNGMTANAIVAQAVEPEIYTDDPPLKGKLNIVPRTISGASTNLYPLNKLQRSNDVRLTGALSSKPDDKKDDNYMQNSRRKDVTARLDRTGLNDKKWSVSMSFGAENYQALNSVRNRNSELIMAAPLLTSSNSVDYVRNKYKDEIMVPDNAGSQYGLPLSAKFIVRKDLNTRWAVESGLSYTYLSTKYKWNKNTANQQLHYLGIPLNVVCYVVSKPGWNIYASAGGMVEKGVHSRIDRNDNLATKIKMKGLQWSVNGMAGVTYKLHKSLGMFFEPQLGYFFDNGQPENIRTECPVSFGLGIGLRFSL